MGTTIIVQGSRFKEKDHVQSCVWACALRNTGFASVRHFVPSQLRGNYEIFTLEIEHSVQIK